MNNLKTLLVAVNSKYVHTNIAVRYICRFCKDQNQDISFSEFSINEPKNNVLAKLYEADCEAYGFSCYIFNIEYVLSLCKSLKKVRPERKIFLGGPEVSFDAERLLKEYGFIDWVISGEGERAVSDLIKNPPKERLVLWGNEPRDFNEIPFPYEDEDIDLISKGEKLAYYETSRGCPFNCSYCLSSINKGVRFLPIERVKKEIKALSEKNIKTIKFVDRTFNADKKRAYEIWKYCMSLDGDTCFHFEIGADLLDESLIDLLKDTKKGQIQFEIGVQTTNEKTISEISRTMNLEVLKKNVSRLRKETLVTLHLDLIAGLPHEDFNSFKKSFNDVYALDPHVISLGFLKLLKGSKLRKDAEKYGICFSHAAPYEIFYNNWMSFKDIIILKGVEDVLDRYFNSGRFEDTLKKAVPYFESPFDFYKDFSEFWKSKGLFGQGVKRIRLYSLLHEFLKERLSAEDLKEVVLIMKKDFSLWHSNGEGTPDWYREY